MSLPWRAVTSNSRSRRKTSVLRPMISARTARIDDNLGRGTDGSNPLPSSGESATNRSPRPRDAAATPVCLDLALDGEASRLIVSLLLDMALLSTTASGSVAESPGCTSAASPSYLWIRIAPFAMLFELTADLEGPTLISRTAPHLILQKRVRDTPSRCHLSPTRGRRRRI